MSDSKLIDSFSDLFKDTKFRLDTPEVWDGNKDWKVNQTANDVPHIDKVNKIFVVPPGACTSARGIVRHEMGHALWSPLKPKGGPYKHVRLALEDAIINKRWEALDLPCKVSEELSTLYDTTFGKLIMEERVSAILYAVASLGFQKEDGTPVIDTSALNSKDTSFFKDFESAVDKYVSVPVSGKDERGREVLVKELTDYLKYVDKEENPGPTPNLGGGADKAPIKVDASGNLENQDELEEAAKEKAKDKAVFGDIPKKRKPRAKLSDTFKENIRKGVQATEETVRATSSSVTQRKREATERISALTGRAALARTKLTSIDVSSISQAYNPVKDSGDSPLFEKKGKFSNDTSIFYAAKWGACELAEPRLDLKDPSIKFKGRKSRPTDEGIILRHPEREFTDGKIFGVKNINKRGGGTIMLDWSGSMSLSSQEVYRLISDAPRKTDVACYSGTNTMGGRIIVCAKNGRFIAENTLNRLKAGGGNVVDGPALAWLSRMAKPRIWISDGHVFGASKRWRTYETTRSVNHQRPAMDLPLLESLFSMMLKYSIIRCENIFQAMLVLRQHIPRESIIFQDSTARYNMYITRTTEARDAWSDYVYKHQAEQWYKDLGKEIQRNGHYADW